MPPKSWPKPQPPPMAPQGHRPFLWGLLLLALNLLVFLAIPALALLALMDLAILYRPLQALGKLLAVWGCWWLFRRLPL